MKKDIINILIRTSDRPEAFKRCLESVYNQTHENIRIYVSADNDETIKYVKSEGINPIRVKSKARTEEFGAPYNLYINELLKQVSKGWVLILDDDDLLAEPGTLESIALQLRSKNMLYFFRMQWPDGRIIPGNTNFKKQAIVRKDFGMPCFMFHAEHIGKLEFKPVRAGDYHFITEFIKMFPGKTRWIDQVVVKTGNIGMRGKVEKKQKINHNKNVVYTAITGNYDKLEDPVIMNKEFDYICFTNNKKLTSDTWKVVFVDSGDLSDIKLARRIKILPHIYLPKYELTIWVDANLKIIKDVTKLVEIYDYGFIAVKHPLRNCVYAESEAVLKAKKDHDDIVNKQIETYKKEGLPENFRLIESGFLIRKNNKINEEFNNKWFNEVLKHSHRDQLSFPYVLWNSELSVKCLLAKEREKYLKRIDHKAVVKYDIPIDKKHLPEVKKVPEFYTGKIDVVYCMGRGSVLGDAELRFSIRSFARHFKDLRNIVIVGHKPAWLTNVIHIPAEDDMMYRDANIIKKIIFACRDKRVSNQFVFCADDKFLLENLSFKEITGWHCGKIAETKSTREWKKWLVNTRNELVKRGLPYNDYNSAHTLQPVDKKEFIEILGKWNWKAEKYVGSNIYNNSTKIFKGVNCRNWHTKLNKEYNYAQIIRKIDNCKTCNTNKEGFNTAFIETINELFKKESKYEIYGFVDNAWTDYMKWLRNGKDYHEGVNLIQRYTKNKYLVKHFTKKGKCERTEKELVRNLAIISRKWMQKNK